MQDSHQGIIFAKRNARPGRCKGELSGVSPLWVQKIPICDGRSEMSAFADSDRQPPLAPRRFGQRIEQYLTKIRGF
ncbi:MAG: hypothetical protein WB760_03930 [Xanthobacteraceae bacterium]